MKTKYSEKLTNPKWQRKRLEILQRDNWTCQTCQSTDRELHIHHKKYTARDPWDEPNENLVAICYMCHKDETEGRKDAEKLLLEYLAELNISVNGIFQIVGLLTKLFEEDEIKTLDEKTDFIFNMSTGMSRKTLRKWIKEVISFTKTETEWWEANRGN